MTLANKVVLITGGSGALGTRLALSLGMDHAKVVVGYRRQAEAADAVVQEIVQNGGEAAAFPLDVTLPMSIDAAVKNVVDMFGTIDILINCVGVTSSAMSWNLSSEDWCMSIDVNLSGAFYCSKAILPIMRSHQWGRVINITSIVGQTGVAGTSAYSASKAGLIGLTKSLAVETANKGITVNAISLGYFDVGMISDVPEAVLEKIVSKIPIQRLGRSEEMIHAVKFLCAEEAAYITGQTININGGLYMG